MKTDAQLQLDVMAELKWDPSIHAAQIGVEVKDGVVTLAGEVSSYSEKWNAEKAAQRVRGVTALAIGMTVKLSALGERTDTDIARSAQTALGWRSPSLSGNIQVMVERGWLTLSGEVEWQHQRQSAFDSVRHLPGVVGVSNEVCIKPKASAAIVKSDIEAALRRRSTADANAISVAVSGADVTLTGALQSWGERDLANQTAWSAAGVRVVIDQMTVIH